MTTLLIAVVVALIISTTYSISCMARNRILNDTIEGMKEDFERHKGCSLRLARTSAAFVELAEAAIDWSENDKFAIINGDNDVAVYRIHNGCAVLVRQYACESDSDDREYKIRCAEELVDMLRDNPD